MVLSYVLVGKNFLFAQITLPHSFWKAQTSEYHEVREAQPILGIFESV